MATPSRLAGLISPEAETLFHRLRIVRSMPARRFREHGAAAEELLDRQLVFTSGADDEIRPLEPGAALRLLLDQEQQHLVATQLRILGAWDQLMAQLPVADGGKHAGVAGIRVLTTAEEVAAKLAELYPSPRKLLRGTENCTAVSNRDRPRTPPPGSLSAGVRFQLIYPAGCLDSTAGTRLIESSAGAGELVRLRSKVPIKMLHVDDSVALVAVDPAARTALLIRAPTLLTMLAEWFDLMWTDPSTVDFRTGNADPALADTARQILSMMPFDDDETIARKLRVSVSTVRRHVRSVYRVLGVNNRFAAGMAATKLGWI